MTEYRQRKEKEGVIAPCLASLILGGLLGAYPAPAGTQEHTMRSDGSIEERATGTVVADGKIAAGRFALRYDGTDDSVRIPDSGDFDFSYSFTVEAWVKPSSLAFAGSYGGMVRASTDAGAGAWVLYGQNGAPGSWGLSVCVPTCEAAVSPAGSLVVNRWQHVAGVYDGSNITVYRNGSQVGAAPHSGDVSLESGLSLRAVPPERQLR